MHETHESRACDLALYDHLEAGDVSCPDPGHRKALEARRLARAGQWSVIERGRDGGGTRDFLDGRPIHCGSGLELQVTEERYDDYGGYTVWSPKGVGVRYEVDASKRVVLYVSVGGATFHKEMDAEGARPWMRFRWPPEIR